jgi:hypothetical protein
VPKAEATSGAPQGPHTLQSIRSPTRRASRAPRSHGERGTKGSAQPAQDGCAPNSPASLSRDPDLGSLRTLPHGSGRSPASRDEPLTPGTRRPLRRGAACGAERAASGRNYQRSDKPNAMPTCSQCFHGGKHHDWTSPPCSAPRCFCIREHPRRLRGRCLMPGCLCTHYVVLGRRKPVNPYIGKARR